MRLVQNVGQASLADRSGDVEQESGKNTPQFERNWFSPHVGRLSGPDLFNNFSSLKRGYSQDGSINEVKFPARSNLFVAERGHAASPGHEFTGGRKTCRC